MICPSPKCVFIHIPKVAGQSIERFFLNLNGLDWDNRSSFLLYRNADRSKGPVSIAHLTAVEYIENGHLTRKDFYDHYRFTFVRNPWARIVSEYHYRKSPEKPSFKDFVRTPPDSDTYYDLARHLMPQYDYIFDTEGNSMVDFVGKFESIQEDFNQLCDNLELPRSTLPHVNKAKRKKSLTRWEKIKSVFTTPSQNDKPHYSTYYDDETKEIIAERYAKDISTFGYTFENRTHS